MTAREMTNRNAIDILSNKYELCDVNCENSCIYCLKRANELAVEALEKQEKYRWHDLRKNPEDLPELYIRKELWFGGNLYSVGDFCGDYWNTDLYRGASKEEYRIPVIAWRKIDPFEGE